MSGNEPLIETMTFEEAFAELERIVQILETSDATLAESIALYEKGQQLSQHCSQLLKAADLKLQTVQEAAENANQRSQA